MYAELMLIYLKISLLRGIIQITKAVVAHKRRKLFVLTVIRNDMYKYQYLDLKQFELQLRKFVVLLGSLAKD